MGTQPLPQKGAEPPIFGPCLLWQNGRMDQDGTWHGGGPWSRPHCIRRDPSFRERSIAAPPTLFGPCLLWPRSPISATAEILFNHKLHRSHDWYTVYPCLCTICFRSFCMLGWCNHLGLLILFARCYLYCYLNDSFEQTNDKRSKVIFNVRRS